MTWLPVYAAEPEGGVLESRGGLCTGIGKAAAAAALTRRLLERPPTGVLLLGVCGAYPDRHVTGGCSLSVGDLCVVERELFADEGVMTPGGFRDLADLGLGEIGPLESDANWTARAVQLLSGVPVVAGATVSTCSGTDSMSGALAARTGCHVETMEGAAVALVCRELSVPWVQVRCVSNHCGDRNRGRWDLSTAATRAQAAAERILDAWND